MCAIFLGFGRNWSEHFSARALLWLPSFKITRQQNPNSAANTRHRENQQRKRREKLEQKRLDALTQQKSSHPSLEPSSSNTAQVPSTRVVIEVEAGPSNLSSTVHRPVSASFGPLVNLVPVDDSAGPSLLSKSRLVLKQGTTSAASVVAAGEASRSLEDISTVPPPPSTDLPAEEESCEELVVSIDPADIIPASPPRRDSIGPQRRRPRSIVIVPEGSGLSGRSRSSSGRCSSRDRRTKRPRRSPSVREH